MKPLKLNIRPSNTRFGAHLLILGGLCLVIVLMLLKLKAEALFLPDIVLVVACFLAMLLGYLKLSEPQYSLTITPNCLRYHHKFGQLVLWRNQIKGVGQVVIRQQMLERPAAFIGIKLKSPDTVLKRMPVRLMLKLIIEQRPVLMEAIKGRWSLGNVPDDWLIEPNQYITHDKLPIRGVKAMFAHRMAHNDALMNYHILIPFSCLDRNEEEFINLLQHWLMQPEQTLKKCCNIN